MKIFTKIGALSSAILFLAGTSLSWADDPMPALLVPASPKIRFVGNVPVNGNSPVQNPMAPPNPVTTTPAVDPINAPPSVVIPAPVAGSPQPTTPNVNQNNAREIDSVEQGTVTGNPTLEKKKSLFSW